MARGCCLLEFLRRDATFSESLNASAHSRNPLLLPLALAPSSAPQPEPEPKPKPEAPAALSLPPLPPAPRLPLPPSLDAAALAAYAGGFRLTVDVMDQALNAILATAVVSACVLA
jgi:hypothetical protein